MQLKHEIKRLVDLLLTTEDLRTVQSLTVQLQRALYFHIEQGGYPVDSGSHYRLWFGFDLRGWRVNYPVMGNRIDGHSLLRQTKEDLAATL